MATGTDNIFLKNIISSSVLIQSGPPAVYQLRTKKEKFGSLTRMTVGEKDENETNKTILLVGETGTGKSSLINVLVNYSMGVKWEDGVWFQIVEEEKEDKTESQTETKAESQTETKAESQTETKAESQTETKAESQTETKAESQTSDVMVYQIFGFEGKTLPYSLTIIDTPGFGDTRGIKHDVLINERLFDLFRSEDGVDELHAVGLVMKASENRLSDRLTYVFNSVTSLFGKNVEKNIVALITHSNGKKPKNVLKALEAAKVKCSRDEKNQPVYFLFDNCQDEERTDEDEDENEEDLKHADKTFLISQKGMKQFTSFLETSGPQKLTTTIEVLNERTRLTTCIQNLQDRIELTELKQTEIRQIHEALKMHEEEMKKNQDYTVDVDEVYKEKEPIDGGMWGLVFYQGAVCCNVCKETCHYPGCTMAWYPGHCEVMKDGRCTVCTNKCPASDHVKENWRYVTKTRRVQKTMKEIIEKYERSKSEGQKKSTLLENLGEEMKKLKAEKSQLLDEAYKHVVRLGEIALNVDSVSTFVRLDLLIEEMKEKGDTEKVQKLEEMKRRVDEKTRSALQYMWRKVTKAGRKLKTRRTRSISSAHQNIISSSVLIQSGPPAVYQLRTKKEKVGSLTRMTVGEKDVNKVNKTILLVGETGAGKSALINTLVNYSMGVKWEDGVWFQIVEEEERSQTESQTSDVMVYQIFGFEGKTLPYSLTIIDTPGFGDTRGIKHDVLINERLFDLFRSEDGVDELHAVGLVMKASENRIHERLSYVYDAVTSLFGKNLEKNTVALITHSDGRKPKNILQAVETARVKCLRNEKNQPVYFLFDNKQKTRGIQKGDVKASKSSWDFTNKELGRFSDFLAGSQSQTLRTTVEVLNERTRLTTCIQNLQDRIELTELKQTEIRQIHEALKMHEEEMKKNQDYTVDVDEVYKDKERIDSGLWWLVFYQGAVCCNVCKETCHYPGCTMAWKPGHCEVMKDGRCTVCTNKCPASDHVKENWRYVTKTRRVQKTMKEIIEKYERSKSEGQKKSTLLENLGEEMKKLKAEKSQLLDEACKHVVRLEEIALNVDSVSTYVHLDFLVEKIKEEGDTEKVQKLEEMKRMDEGTRSSKLKFCQELKLKVSEKRANLRK